MTRIFIVCFRPFLSADLGPCPLIGGYNRQWVAPLTKPLEPYRIRPLKLRDDLTYLPPTGDVEAIGDLREPHGAARLGEFSGSDFQNEL